MKTWCQLAGSENYLLRLSERDAKEGVTTPPRLQLADELDAPFMTEQHFWLVSIGVLHLHGQFSYHALVFSRRGPYN